MNLSRGPSRWSVAVAFLSTALLAMSQVWAQNENETTGFRTNHVFEGSDGDNIDLVSGGLTLTIPLGPKFQVNDRLGYQLLLAYNSKVWDYSEWGDNTADQAINTKLRNLGPLGVGFTLNFGRIVQDARWGACAHPNEGWYQKSHAWSWITPDGGAHDIRWSSDCPGSPEISDTAMMTTDQSYAQVDRSATEFTIKTTDGMLYTLAHHIADYDNAPDNSLRADNFSFGGWYVTKIEDPSIPVATRPFVTVTYDTTKQFYSHAIARIDDSHNRAIVFHNGVVVDGTCTPNAPASSRKDVVTCSIDVPKFTGSEAVSGAVATYQFIYQVATVTRAYPGENPTTIPGIPQLVRIDFPTYADHSSASHTYSIYFDYKVGPVNNGEMTCRSLPVERDTSKTCESYRTIAGEVSYKYTYSFFQYQSVFINGGQSHSWEEGGYWIDYPPTNQSYLPANHIPGQVHHSVGGHATAESGYGRVVSEKRMYGPKMSGPVPEQHAWTYDRPSSPATNPQKVTVTDGLGNDTVYHFHASLAPTDDPSRPDGPVGEGADDGIAPEWDDGLNYKTEYYRGTGGNRVLLRWEEKEYDADKTLSGQNLKNNTRLRRTRTVNVGVNMSESIVTSSDWDGIGNWRTQQRTGSDVDGTVTRRTAYVAKLSPSYIMGLVNHDEVNDGSRVLSRTDNEYDANGRLKSSISRKTLPAAIDLHTYLTAVNGDVRTSYTYSSSDGSLSTKILSSKGDGGPKDFCIDYTWLRGAYLKSKTFKDCSTGVPLGWKAIDRVRDGNTGAIARTKDTALFETTFTYDAIGRLTDIDPPSPEHPTDIDYASLRQTTVRRGPSASDYEFRRYTYDALGRLICEEKRPADGGDYPYQATRYEFDGRVAFKSEWLPGGASSCSTTTTQGTTFSYGTPPDPFGRVMSTTTVDDKVTTTSYDGLDTFVTVQGVTGAGGVSRNITTRYLRDAWSRLIMVDPPADGGAQAAYRYDLRDNLVQVDLFARSNGSAQSRFFEYDSLGRLFFATNPESGTVVNTSYDALGNVLSMTDASGTTFNYEYDGAGRLRKLFRAGVVGPLAEYTYDQGPYAAGKLSKVMSASDEGGWRLDKNLSYLGMNGRLGAVSYQPLGWPSGGYPVVTYNYDNFGNVGSIAYPAAGPSGPLTVVYQYSNGKPVSVRDASTNLVLGTVTYGAAGNILSLTTPNSGKSEIDPDERNRPSYIRIGGLNQSNVFDPTRDYNLGPYAYDGAGNISAIGPDLYRYDASNRLIEAIDHRATTVYTQCFQYDDFGNIVGIVDDEGATPTVCSPGSGAPPALDNFFTTTGGAPTYVNTNRILSGSIGGLQTFFQYDAKGNTIKDLTKEYRYDVRNRLVSVSQLLHADDPRYTSRELARYDYDANNLRLWKNDLGRELATLSIRGEDGLLLTEFRRTSYASYGPEWVRDHVYLAGKLVSVRENRRPQPPGGLVATVLRNDSVQPPVSNVTLRWPTNPPEDEVTYYQVYRATSGQMAAYAQANTTCPGEENRICWTDSGVLASSSVSYQVAAVSPAGTSYASDGLTFTAGDTTAPLAPRCLKGTAADGLVTLSWMPPSPNTDVLGYNVYRSETSSESTSLKINDTLVGEVGYVDSGLENNDIYYYWVRAVDNVGNVSPVVDNANCNPSLPPVFWAMPKDYAPPAPPRGLMVAGDCNSGSSATLTWEPNPASDYVTRYKVYRSPDFSTGGPKDAGVDPQDNPNYSFVDTGLSAVTSYYYWVVAEDAIPNFSAPSQKVGVTTKQVSAQLAVPPGKLMLQAGNGQVRVRFTAPTAANRKNIAAFSIYRKLNVEQGCGAYQRVGQVFANGRVCHGTQDACSMDSQCYPNLCDEYFWTNNVIDFHDGVVPNNLAWDYAVASVTETGAESGFSEHAYAIPTAPVENYRECLVEPCGGNNVLCGISAYDRCVVARWNPPVAPVYQPTPSTPDPGALSYLVGYRAQDYVRTVESTNWVNVSYVYPTVYPEDVGNNRACTLTGKVCTGNIDCKADVGFQGQGRPEQVCVEMAKCKYVPANTCGNCPTGEQCINGKCEFSPVKYCLEKADCPALAECIEDDVGNSPDPYRIPLDAPVLQIDSARLAQSYGCQSVMATYKVYADGNWITVQSAASGNFDGSDLSGSQSVAMARCNAVSINVCEINQNTPLCSSITTEPPQLSAAPVASLNSSDNTRIELTWQAPQNPTELAKVAGYHVYVRERIGGSLRTAPYGHSRRTPWITVDPTTTAYSFVNLPRFSRLGQTMLYEFTVATFDIQGRVSKASPASNQILPFSSSNAPPVGLKQVLWTVSDSVRDDGTGATLGPANPRTYDGIKLQWKNNSGVVGGGFRVYRSNLANGIYCALLKTGPNNPPGVNICNDSGAYSDTLTRSVSESGVNRMFHLDLNVVPGTTYYYKLTTIGATGNPPTESGFSNVIEAVRLPRPQGVPSAPRHLKAWAPLVRVIQNNQPYNVPGRNVYLKWCPNPAQENVTAYRIYRSKTQGGPYYRIVEIDNEMGNTNQKKANCTMGSRKCTIECQTAVCQEPSPGQNLNTKPIVKDQSCTSGRMGDCRIMDTTVLHPVSGSLDQDGMVYYYVVTAVAGTIESAYSNENVALPNYCGTGTSCGSYLRYDPDNEGDVSCDDENAGLLIDQEGEEEIASACLEPREQSVAEDAEPSLPARIPSEGMLTEQKPTTAPYRVIGAKYASIGGAEGTTPGGGGTFTPPPVIPRWLFYHTDHLGNTRVIMDVNGQVLKDTNGQPIKHDFLPFGEERPVAVRTSSNTNYFTGHERDVESKDDYGGLDYMLARYYSSSLGRFMAVDPGDDTALEDPQSLNKYAYVRNNPLRFMDPNGEESFECVRPFMVNDSRNPIGHMFVVSGAPALGAVSSETQFFSYGATSWDAMGRVTTSSGTSSVKAADTAATDMISWEAAGTPGSTTVCSPIPASDEAVASSGDAVMPDTTYSAIGGGTFGINSNSGAHAVAEDSAQACLEPPGTSRVPGAQSSSRVNFDKDKNGTPDPKPGGAKSN